MSPNISFSDFFQSFLGIPPQRFLDVLWLRSDDIFNLIKPLCDVSFPKTMYCVLFTQLGV